MDRLTSMSVFAKVADLGSFAAAAKELRLSPTMIGKHIRFLEERLRLLVVALIQIENLQLAAIGGGCR